VNRRASVAVLGLAAAVVVGCALFLFVGIAAGVWQPRGAPPVQPTPGSGNGGFPLGARSYGDFLADVQAGNVVHASQQGQLVQVDSVNGPYTVDAPPGEDVFGDMQAAADNGGVPIPAFDLEGEVQSKTVTYEQLLTEVRAGHVTDITHQGREVHATGIGAELVATVPSADTDVLKDIEEAARAGNVAPPFYSKVPEG
jgi:hypothetical protein